MVEKWGFRRELSTETGLFVEKLRLMLGLSIGRGGLVEKKCVGNVRNICEVGLYVE